MKRFTGFACLAALTACAPQPIENSTVDADSNTFELSQTNIECAGVIGRANQLAALRFQKAKQLYPALQGEPPRLFSVVVKVDPATEREINLRFASRDQARFPGFRMMHDGVIKLSLVTSRINLGTGQNVVATAMSSTAPRVGHIHFVAGLALVDALRSDFRWCGDDEIEDSGFGAFHELIETNAREELEKQELQTLIAPRRRHI